MPGLSKSERMDLWRDRLNRFAESQLTVAEFCRREGISAPSFYQWKRRLSSKVQASTSDRRNMPASSSTSSGFTELVVSSPDCGAIVSLPGSVTISLGANTELAAMIVDRVLQHTQQRPC